MSSGKQIAKLLRKAANQHLWDGDWSKPSFGNEQFSCCAVEIASIGLPYQTFFDALGHLRRLGVRTESEGEFSEIAGYEARQGARFLWLHFAALVAEDGGI